MINDIRIINFRNILKLNTALSPNGNLIVAPNGSGKSNLIEAIFYVSNGSSYRPIVKNSDFINFDSEFLRIELTTNSNKIEYILSKNGGNGTKKLLLNTKPTTQSKIYEKLQAVLFAPHSVDLVLGDPSQRRDDINFFLSALDKEYRSLIKSYTSVLKNRNALLKNISKGKMKAELLDFWTEKISRLSFDIMQKRKEYFEEISPILDRISKELTVGKYHIEYLPSFNSENTYEKILQKYKENAEKEIIVCKTLYGIHKDDFNLYIDDKLLKFNGSRGQQRLGSFLYKLAQMELFKKHFDAYPLLLIDDLMSELDDKNRQKIANVLSNSDFQYILTSADADEVPEIIKYNSKEISLS